MLARTHQHSRARYFNTGRAGYDAPFVDGRLVRLLGMIAPDWSVAGIVPVPAARGAEIAIQITTLVSERAAACPTCCDVGAIVFAATIRKECLSKPSLSVS
jgi:hypothetical protein